GPAVLLLSDALLPSEPGGLARLPEHVVVLAADAAGRREGEAAGRLFLSLEDLRGEEGVAAAFRAAAAHSAALPARSRTRVELDRISGHVRELSRIGLALMSERDPEQLLDLILTQARRLTSSDAGSLYLVERDADGRELLH